jgi:hypothetical protein
MEFPGTFGAAPTGFVPPAAPSIIGALASLILFLAGFSFAPFEISVRSAPLPGWAFTAGGRTAGGAGGGGGGGMAIGICQKTELIRTTYKVRKASCKCGDVNGKFLKIPTGGGRGVTNLKQSSEMI